MRIAFGVLGILVMTGALVACAQNAAMGQSVYDKHCSMCHGPTGQGDGDFVDKLLILPPDLTTLSRVNGGDFPRLRVSEAIIGSGRGEHFSGAMPEFSEVAGTGTLADYRLEALLTYLESIQI
ncbi:cytochrome c [uncultured Shimia sp.]|uniref:c-type cytochrome n=1 Tax=uncultured Shimia sp. TaxID=573152 RepID=UPI00260FFC3D|nr:cytochrome c [uncultured Shimia sp.]